MIAQIDPKTKEARYFDIRKLTPRECGRLMGVPEGALGRMIRGGITNSSLYKLFGNSIVVDVLAAIYRRLWYADYDDVTDPNAPLPLFDEKPWTLAAPADGTPLRVVTLCSGYDAQCLALEVLAEWSRREGHTPLNYDLVAWSEFDPESRAPLERQPAVVAHNLIFPQYADRNVGDMTKVDWNKVIEEYEKRKTRLDDIGHQEYAHGDEGTDGRDTLHWQRPQANGEGTAIGGESVSAERSQSDYRSEVGRQSDADAPCGTPFEIDLLTYSTPCTDISQAGKRAGIAPGSGTRSAILWHTEDAVKALRPKILLQENVAALVNQQNIGWFREWQRTLQRLGYDNYWQVLNARDIAFWPDLGPVPQNRDRVFMVSVRKDLHQPPFQFPRPTVLRRTIADILEEDAPESFFLKPDSVCAFLRKNQQEPMVYHTTDHKLTKMEIEAIIAECKE